jgi:hypothetical protein
MTTKSLRPFASAFCAVILLAGAGLSHAAIPAAENLLPADTLGFVTVPDCSVLRTAAKVSPQMLFWNDPAMKPFHDNFMNKLNEKFTASLEKDLGLKISDFADLLQGQFTLAMTDNGSNGHDDIPPGVILLLDAKDKSDLLKTNLATLVKKWTDNGRAMRTEQIHGLSFTVVTLSSNDLASILPQRQPVSEIGKTPKPEKPVDIYFTQFQSLLLAVNSPKVAETVASRLTGGSAPVIADDATFAADKLSQFHNAPTYYGWLNAKLFINIIMQTPESSSDSDSPSAMTRPSPAKIIAALGLGGLKSLSMAMHESRDGSFLNLHLGTTEDPRTGLLKILTLSAKDASPPAFVPADAIKFSRVRLDGRQLWSELLKVAAAISPNALAGINSVVDMANASAQQRDPSFDLRNSLFGNIGDDMISYQKPPVGNAIAQLASPPTLTLVGSANPDQIVQSIKILAGMLSPQGSTPPRDFQGHKIYTITQRSQAGPNGTAITPPPLIMSSAAGYAAFTSDTGILEEFLRSSDGKLKPLSSLPGLSDALTRAGGISGGMAGYQNQREAIRSTFTLLKNANDSNLFLKMFPQDYRKLFDFTLLPEFDTVSKYFYMSVFAGSTTSAGSTINVFTPRPPQLN